MTRFRLLARAGAVSWMTLLLLACEMLPGAAPRTVVGDTLDAIADRDLVRASASVCPEARDVTQPPIPLPGLVLPFGDLPVTAEQALGAVTLDLTDLRATESIQGDRAQVRVSGGIGLTFDVAATQALINELSADGNGPDPDEVERILMLAGLGEITMSMDSVVSLERRDGRWLVCGAEVGR